MDGLLSFLTPEQQAIADRQARQAMLTQLGFGLLQASTGAPGQRRPSLGQIVGQAGPAAMQAYQGSFDRTLQQIMLQQQMAEQQRQRAAQQKQQTALQTFISTLPEDQRARFEAFPTQAAEAMFREPSESFRQLTPDEASARGLPANKTYQISSKTGKVSELGGGGVSVTVPVTVSTEKRLGEALAGKVAEEDAALRNAAMSAPGQLETIQQSRQLLEKGNVFTGAFANTKLRLAAAGQAFGITGKDTDEVITNTQLLFKNRAKATLDSVRASGLGAGQGFTDKDREFLEKAVLGNIEFTPDALKRQLDIEEKVARGTVNKWNTRIKQLPKSVVEGTGITPVELTAPQQRPSGIDAFNLQDAARQELDRRGIR